MKKTMLLLLVFVLSVNSIPVNALITHETEIMLASDVGVSGGRSWFPDIEKFIIRDHEGLNPKYVISDDGISGSLMDSEKARNASYCYAVGNGLRVDTTDPIGYVVSIQERKSWGYHNKLVVCNSNFELIKETPFAGWFSSLRYDPDGYFYVGIEMFDENDNSGFKTGFYRTADFAKFELISKDPNYMRPFYAIRACNGYYLGHKYNVDTKETEWGFLTDENDFYKIVMEGKKLSYNNDYRFAKNRFMIIDSAGREGMRYSFDGVYVFDYTLDWTQFKLRNCPWWINEDYVFLGLDTAYYENADYLKIRYDYEQYNYVRLNNEILGFSVPPAMEDGRMLVPMRFLFEKMGADVGWYDQYKMVVAQQKDMTVEVSVDSKIATVNGKTVVMDVPARLINGKTMVPLRFISENFGYKVSWDDRTRIASIVQ